MLGDDDCDPVPAYPPVAVVRDMLSTPTLPLPGLAVLTALPFVTPDGSVVTRPGYDAGSQYFYAPPPGFQLRPVPECPTPAQVAAARALILDELLGDFPFADPADRATAIAAVLLPAVRALITGPTPLHVIDAPSPGSGKGLLADCICRVATGRPAAILPAVDDDDEWRKRLTALTSKAPAAVVIDNVTGVLGGAALSAALTAEVWEGRVLGQTTMVRLLVRHLWLATGNNLRVTAELARRTVFSRLEYGGDQPRQCHTTT